MPESEFLFRCYSDPQYASQAYREMLAEHGLKGSMGRAATPTSPLTKRSGPGF